VYNVYSEKNGFGSELWQHFRKLTIKNKQIEKYMQI